MSYRNLIDLDDVAAGNGGIKITGENARDFAGRVVAGGFDINGDGFDDLIVGAYGNDSGGNSAGAAYVVFGVDGGFDRSINLDDIAAGSGGFKIVGQNASDFAGRAVSGAGDVNDDGIDDLLVGANGNDGGGNYAGAAYVVFGKSTGFSANVNLDDVASGGGGFKIQGQQEPDRAGISVSSAGDVNGDGIDDLLVGATNVSNDGLPGVGATYVVFGRDSTPANILLPPSSFPDLLDLDTVAQGTGGFRLVGSGRGDNAGASVAAAGDVNNDGFDDIIIGADRYRDASNSEVGGAYVVFGKGTGFGATVDLSAIAAGNGGFLLTGESQQGFPGHSVAGAGDVNGDGFDDVVVGAFGQNPNGAAYVVFGKSDGFGGTVALSTIAAGTGGFKIVGQDHPNLAGYSVAGAGDVNGDGFDDVIVGAAGQAGEPGAAYVVFGKAGGFATPVDLEAVAIGDGGFKIAGASNGDITGSSVSAAGDLDGDGFDDLLVGARNDSEGGTFAGAAYVVYGQAANQAPVATDDVFTLDEDNPSFTGERVLLRGPDSDADGDPLTVVAVGGAAGNVGVATDGSNGGRFTIAADGSLAFDPDDDFFGLGQNVSRTTTVSYTITDGHGSFDTAEVSVRVEGLNDDPTVAQAMPDLRIVGGPPVSIALLAPDVAFVDPDYTDLLTYQSVQGLPTGLRYDAGTNTLEGAAGQLGRFTVVATVTDQHGATASQSFELDVAAASTLFTNYNDTRDLNSINVDAFGNSATRALGGNDVVTLSDTGQRGVIFLAGTGDDRIVGSINHDRIHGDAGKDTLSGGIGNDTLWGDAGKDTLTGGAGADHFAYLKATDSTLGIGGRDVVTDFSRVQGDRIDLSALDADTGTAGSQDFTFIGSSTFSAAGQVRFSHPTAYSTKIELNLDSDATGEMSFELAGKITLDSSDFLL
jgi:Ca2+-binding RTX toxin-like protein